MTIKKVVGTLTRTAGAAALHPLRSGAWVFGLAKGTIEGSKELLHGSVFGEDPRPGVEAASDQPTLRAAREAPAASVETPETVSTSTATEPKDPRDKIPGPDLAAFQPPAPEDLPEPIVIVAEDEEPGEEFHNEPKAASRDSGGASDGQAEIDEVLMELEADAKRQR